MINQKICRYKIIPVFYLPCARPSVQIGGFSSSCAGHFFGEVKNDALLKSKKVLSFLDAKLVNLLKIREE